MEVYDYLMILSLKYHIDPGFLARHYNRPDDQIKIVHKLSEILGQYLMHQNAL